MAEMSQREVEELLYQLRRLVEELNQQRQGTQGLSETRSTATEGRDRGIDRLILALGRLSSQLDGERKTKAQEQADMLKFAKATDAASDAQEEQRKQIEENIKAAEAEAKAREETARRAAMSQAEIDDERFRAEQQRIAEDKKKRQDEQKGLNQKLIDGVRDSRYQRDSARTVFEQFSATGGMAERLKDGFLNLWPTSLGAQAGLQLLTAAVGGATKGMISMSKSLHKGERGAKVSAEALSELATPLLNVASIIGQVAFALSFFLPGGILVRSAVKLGGILLQTGSSAGKLALELNKLASEQVDALFKSFRTLSSVGAVGARGLDDVFDTLQTLGMSVAEIEEFNSMVTQSSQKLALMGGTVAQGTRAFGEVAGGLYKSRLGQELEMLGFTAQEQREAALAYLNIQARTGQMQLKNTAQLIQGSAKFAKELDLVAQLTGQSRKEQAAAREAAQAETRFRAAKIAAEQRGDEEELKRLNIAERMAGLAKAAGDERGFTGILQAAAGGGALTTPEAIAAEMTYRVSEILARPNITEAQMLEMMGQSVKAQQQTLAETNRFSGNIDMIQTNLASADDIKRLAESVKQEAAKAGFTGPDAVAKFMETEQGKRMAAGGDTKTMVEAGRLQQSAAMIQDSALRKFNVAADINNAASKLFDSAVKLFARTLGVTPPAGGTPTAGGAPTASGSASEAAIMAALGAAPGRSASGLAGLPGSAAVTTASGAKAFSGGIMGKIEEFITQGRGFRSYQQTGAMNPEELFSFRGGTTGHARNLQQLDPEFQKRLIAMAQEYHELTGGKKLPFGSGQRSQEENTAVGGAQQSRHLTGRAADLSADAVSELRSMGLLEKHGFRQNPAAGAWHIEGYRFGGVATGPKSGYTAQLHGTEAVVPLPDNRSIPVEMPNFDRGLERQADMLSAQLTRLDEVVTVMRNQLDVSQRILQVAQN